MALDLLPYTAFEMDATAKWCNIWYFWKLPSALNNRQKRVTVHAIRACASHIDTFHILSNYPFKNEETYKNAQHFHSFPTWDVLEFVVNTENTRLIYEQNTTFSNVQSFLP